MHYYKRNIGDYAKKTGRLSILEHGAYTLLIDSCYDRERFPTMREAIEWSWAISAEEVAAVESVLTRFFDLVDGRYIQNRISEEIENYHNNANNNQRIAIEREAKKREARENARLSSTKREQSVNVPSTNEHGLAPNQEPLTTNQEPRTIESKTLVATATVGQGLNQSESFSIFWKLYPNKTAKAAAEKAWAKLKPDDELLGEIITGLSTQVESGDWLKDGGKFIPHPATWLNGRRWEDEVKQAPTSKHHGFENFDYTSGLKGQNEDGSYAI
jgi:uncharacterized protein YdaU (DUF1376 family)